LGLRVLRADTDAHGFLKAAQGFGALLTGYVGECHSPRAAVLICGVIALAGAGFLTRLKLIEAGNEVSRGAVASQVEARGKSVLAVRYNPFSCRLIRARPRNARIPGGR